MNTRDKVQWPYGNIKKIGRVITEENAQLLVIVCFSGISQLIRSEQESNNALNFTDIMCTLNEKFINKG